jgi:hypothetical protein
MIYHLVSRGTQAICKIPRDLSAFLLHLFIVRDYFTRFAVVSCHFFPVFQFLVGVYEGLGPRRAHTLLVTGFTIAVARQIVRSGESGTVAAAETLVAVYGGSVIFQGLLGASLCAETSFFGQVFVEAFFPPVWTVNTVTACTSLRKEIAIHHAIKPYFRYSMFADVRRRGNSDVW